MCKLTKLLEQEFKKYANPKIALGQKLYMKNNFEFYGIKTPLRHKIEKPFFAKESLPSKKELDSIIKELWGKPQRGIPIFFTRTCF